MSDARTEEGTVGEARIASHQTRSELPGCNTAVGSLWYQKRLASVYHGQIRKVPHGN